MSVAKTTEQCFSQFHQLLTQQISSLKMAATYLNAIKESIHSNDLEALQKLIKNNAIPLSDIEKYETERFNLTEQCGFEKNKNGFISCIKSHDNSDLTLDTLQKELYNAMDELKIATEVNDLLVTKNKQRIQHSLEILTGTTLNKTQTYSAEGTKQQGGLTRPLAIA